MDAREIICRIYLRYGGNWTKIYNHISSKYKKVPLIHINLDFNYVTIIDEDYNKKLKKLSKPPFMYMYNGDLSKLRNDYVFITNPKKHLKSVHYCYIVKQESYWKLKFSNSDTYIYAYTYADIIKIALAFSKNCLVCRHSSKKLVSYIMNYLSSEDVNIFVEPTIKESVNNSLIKSGAFLYDSEKDLITSEGD